MAVSKGQRVGAFILAMLFLMTTLASAGYVIWQLVHEDDALVNDTSLTSLDEQQTQSESEQPVNDETTKLENFTGPVAIPTLRFDDLVAGDGEVVQPSDTVTIHYTGALASDGTVFDSSVSRGEPATFPLDNLIQGWQEGIPGMKVGGTRRLYIPAAQGYGVAPEGYVFEPGGRPLGDLVFDIELFATER